MGRKIAKYALSWVSAVVNALRLNYFIGKLESSFAYLNGKGAASDFHSSGEISALQKLLQRDAIIFDVGANNGEWALALARGLESPKFFMFECAPICLAEIEKRLPKLRGQLFPYAVSDERGIGKMFTPIRGSGLSSLHERSDVGINQETYEEIFVEKTTVDDFVDREGVEKIDLLKMDIEGHELSALKGATSSINAGKVQSIMFEFGSANVNSRTYFRDFWNMLHHSFNVYRITPGGDLLRISAYSEELEYFRGSTNYLATRKT
jgi:FkbM family methyltransferase